MSRLPDAHIAQVCRDAGFVGDELHTAIATAFASSGGIPGYDFALWPGPTAHYRGLWGVDTVERPDIADRDLHNPYVAAHAAHELVEATGGWAWCPAYRAGIHPNHYRDAAVVADMLPAPGAHLEPVLTDAHRSRVHRAIDRIGAARDMLATIPTPRG